MKLKPNRRFLFPFAAFCFLVIVTTIFILYGQGYRFGFNQGKVAFGETGILAAKSVPTGAQVLINGHLTTATDNTINLTAGTYNIEITKDGYFAWKKTITIQKEVVSQANAILFPTSPISLQAITNLGALNPVIDPSGTKIAYTVASQSAQKNGVYVIDISSRPLLTLQGSATQITDESQALFSGSKPMWSPDGSQLLATITNDDGSTTTYQLGSGGFNNTPQDVTETLPAILSSWQTLTAQKTKAQFASLPKALKSYAKVFSNIEFSPDETKILYQASSSATLPFIKNPRLIGLDSTPEQRNLTKGAYYVYDIKNDQNFVISVDDPNSEKQEPVFLQWFADSAHLVYVHKEKIDIMEYDGINSTTVYAGPFIDHSVYVSPNDTSKITILTNFDNPTIAPNLYSISLQ